MKRDLKGYRHAATLLFFIFYTIYVTLFVPTFALSSFCATRALSSQLLFKAVQERDIIKAKRLIIDGADIKALDGELKNPYQKALERGYFPMVKLLAFHKMKAGYGPIDSEWYESLNYERFASFFIALGLKMAVSQERYKEINEFLADPQTVIDHTCSIADVSAREKKLFSLLRYSIGADLPEQVDSLLAAGAPCYLASINNQEQPLSLAVETEHSNFFKKILPGSLMHQSLLVHNYDYLIALFSDVSSQELHTMLVALLSLKLLCVRALLKHIPGYVGHLFAQSHSEFKPIDFLLYHDHPARRIRELPLALLNAQPYSLKEDSSCEEVDD